MSTRAKNSMPISDVYLRLTNTERKALKAENEAMVMLKKLRRTPIMFIAHGGVHFDALFFNGKGLSYFDDLPISLQCLVASLVDVRVERMVTSRHKVSVNHPLHLQMEWLEQEMTMFKKKWSL